MSPPQSWSSPVRVRSLVILHGALVDAVVDDDLAGDVAPCPGEQRDRHRRVASGGERGERDAPAGLLTIGIDRSSLKI
jgi:hypothetical protein